MPKHTIEISKENTRIINVVKAVNDVKSIDKAVAFIIEDYANSQSYVKFIADKRRLKNVK